MKEDMNEAGLKRGKKTAVTANPHGKGGFQMEDVSLAEFPFDGDSRKALFCVFDGHAGVGAAETAKKTLPGQLIKYINEATGGKGMPTDLTEILPVTFLMTDELMKQHEYEGCTATAVVVWQVGKDRYIQAANVGDSRAFLCREKEIVRLTHDHKLAEEDERTRMANCGVNINDVQTRINGALGRFFWPSRPFPARPLTCLSRSCCHARPWRSFREGFEQRHDRGAVRVGADQAGEDRQVPYRRLGRPVGHRHAQQSLRDLPE